MQEDNNDDLFTPSLGKTDKMSDMSSSVAGSNFACKGDKSMIKKEVNLLTEISTRKEGSHS